ncbi:MAG: HAD-IC family P-type ATPase [Anaerolineae bacterium]|nr:HAD-IC family P-type ATPase [Anaerolineae bacterium]
MHNEPVVLCGLSEQEAAERRARGLGNDARLKTGRTYGQIVRENLLTFFNLVLFGLGGVLLLLGSPRDAFFTAAIGLVNALIATAQEVRAKIKLDRIALLARPRAIVIREGQEKEVDPSAVVVGDLLVAGPGDQILVDGVLVSDRGADLDESLLTGESDPVPKKPGDVVYSGTFVLNGRVVYEAQKVGKESFANKLAQSARTFTRELTPLQREVNLAVRVLLLLVLFFGVLIVDDYIINHNLTILESVQAASVVFGLAPSSLFLMIVVTYALGAVRIVDKGALVQKSNAVESLCHVDVLCLDKTGTLTANKIRLNEVVPLAHLDADSVRQILGAYARSVSVANRTSEAIAAACDGALRPIRDEVPFSSARKWSALAFDDTDSEPVIHGTYVLGAPEILEPALAQGDGAWQATAQEWAEEGQRVVMFAFRPEMVPLSDPGGQPCLPPDLISLGLLGFTDELRPDARRTLDGFRQAGIQVKIISGDNPQTVAALARQAGLGEEGAPLPVVSGLDLAAMDDSQFAQAAGEAAIFGRITPEQKQRLVQALRARGRYAAMTGDGVNDVLALKHAKLSIAMQSGTPATRGVADIVLLGDAFSALPEAFLEGQRIMNSMGDVLRLYLTRILCLAINIATVSMLAAGFPYTPAQNSVIAIFTLSIPSLALALWARPAPVPHGSVLRRLANFVIPATIVTAPALSLVYAWFYTTTRDIAYSQLMMTYATITTGLLLVVFVEPPTRFFAGGDQLAGDWRPTILVLGLFVVMLISPWVPALNDFFSLGGLRQPVDALIIGGITLVWMLVLRFTWKLKLFDRYLEVELQPVDR